MYCCIVLAGIMATGGLQSEKDQQKAMETCRWVAEFLSPGRGLHQG